MLLATLSLQHSSPNKLQLLIELDMFLLYNWEYWRKWWVHKEGRMHISSCDPHFSPSRRCSFPQPQGNSEYSKARSQIVFHLLAERGEMTLLLPLRSYPEVTVTLCYFRRVKENETQGMVQNLCLHFKIQESVFGLYLLHCFCLLSFSQGIWLAL